MDVMGVAFPPSGPGRLNQSPVVSAEGKEISCTLWGIFLVFYREALLNNGGYF